MGLRKISREEHGHIAERLARYWGSRGMLQYDRAWALGYLREGHSKEIKGDEFFVLREGDEVLGMISLVTDVSDVAEIRDEVAFQGDPEDIMKEMVSGILELAKKRGLRKVFSLALGVNAGVYRDLGFQEEGTLKSHFTEGEDLTVMSRFL